MPNWPRLIVAMRELLLAALLVVSFNCAPAIAEQGSAQPQDTPPRTAAELEQLVAPIALYPDDVLAQILMASTYPLEVVQAARWSRRTRG